MPTYKTHGLIINRHNLGEADRIITILTPELGTIRAVAKGVRRIKSKLGGHVELFCQSELILAKGKNLDILTSARLLRHPAGITDDYDKMRLAYLFAEMVDKLSGEREHHDGLYQLAAHGYSGLTDGPANSLMELWFKLQLLAVLGYHPQLDSCVICGAGGEKGQYSFNVELGGIVDAGCRGAGAVPMSHVAIKLWRILLSNPIARIRQVGGATEAAAEALDICNLFYDYTFGRRFKSSEVL